MKRIFQSRPLHITACALLFWKGISIIAFFLLSELGVLTDRGVIFFSTGFASSFVCLFVASRGIVSFVVMCVVLFLVFWTFFVLLAINRAGAGVASIALLVFCALDFPTTFSASFEEWWAILVCIVFHAAIFITIVKMRRSRAGIPTWLNKLPDSI